MPKQFELLSELVPHGKAIVVLVNPNNANAERVLRDAQDAARAKRVQFRILKALTDSEIDTAFTTLAQLCTDALVVGSDPFFGSRWGAGTAARRPRKVSHHRM
jgi:ABC-type uncharacterized transport system substrate-binding protein